MQKLKNKLLLISFFLFFLGSFHLYAQPREWTGKVWDENLNEPLIGVTVTIKGSNQGTITNADGEFTISAETGQQLVFSYIGYESVELTLLDGNVTNLSIQMREDTQLLEEVVVVGYGVQKKASLVGSIATTKGEDLMKTGNVTSVSESLQGVLPGVVSVMVDGKPGADEAKITIRGRGSWVSSEPLILVDGVERDMNDLDINEIESISVLKDASATAVYGVKGANGVILVTTKRGKNTQPKINFSANFGFKEPLTHPEYADHVTAMRLWNEAAANDLQYAATIPESTIAAWENAYATGNIGPYNPYFPVIDWREEMVKEVAFSEQYNLNVNGGSDFMRYFASIGYLHDGDVYKTKKNDLFDPSFNYKRYNWRANLDFNLTKTTVFTFNFSGRQGYRNQPGYRADGNNENDDAFGQTRFFSTLYSAPRNVFPIQWPDGTYGVSTQGAQSDNLYLMFDMGQRIYKYNQNFIDFSFKQDLEFITKGLNFTGKLAYNTQMNSQSKIQRYPGGNFGESDYIAYYKKWDYSRPLDGGGYAAEEEIRIPNNDYQGNVPSASYDDILDGGYSKKLYYEMALNYDRNFSDHNITALALFNRNQNDQLRNATNMQFQYRDEAWVTRFTYNWKERYLTEFNGSYTGSPKFARGKRYQFFPSFSLGWRISEEPWIKRVTDKTLNNLKLRYSYGIVGYDRAASSFTYVQMYENTGGSVGFGDEIRTNYGPIYIEGQTANINATWETAHKQNLGIDLMLFDKLTATVDVYAEHREGILMPVWISGMTGASQADGNVGKTKSRGYEMELGWKDKINKDWSYWINANYAFNENRIVFRNDAYRLAEYLKNAGKPIGSATKMEVIGYYESLDDIYNYGLANNLSTQGRLVPGDFMYLDYDADGIIDATKDRVHQKNTNFPAITYGWTLGLQYKSFQISALFYGVSRIYKEVDSSVLWDFEYGQQGIYSASMDATGRWTPDNKEKATKPALHSQFKGYSSSGGTTYSFQNAAYLRLKNVELSYHINSELLNRLNMGISSLQLYANGNNLLTRTKFNKQLDPEGSSSSVYPMVRRYSFGVRMSF
ncbi:MAG: TonB-dependent receptor [Proteiniphilum sp.]|nr:TonB-dependent receptor [Proteiniphilum sp.]